MRIDRRNRHFWIAVFLFFLFLGASTIFAYSSRKGSEGKIQNEDVDIVSNPKEPVPEPGSRKRIIFVEEITIGESEGDENYMFGESVQVIADDEGCIYVTDWDRKRIQKYSPDGKYLLSIGRKGQGPGEFGNIWSPTFDNEGNLYATDIVNKKVAFFDRDGEFLRSIKIPQYIGSVFILPNGYYFTTKTERSEDANADKYIYIHGVYDKEFNLIDEIHRDFHNIRNRGNRSRSEFLADIMSESAFKPFFVWHVTNDGRIYGGFNAAYEIRIYDQEGNHLNSIRREYDPIKISQKHKDQFFNKQVESFLRGLPTDASLKDEIRKYMKYPKNLPAYFSFSLMDNGWLCFIVDMIEDDYCLIDLFDEKGVYIGRFKTNAFFGPVHFKNGKAYAVVTSDDYKYIRRFRYEIKSY
jgi:hypothetical protein